MKLLKLMEIYIYSYLIRNKINAYTIEPKHYNLNTIGINGPILETCKYTFSDWLFAITCSDPEIYDSYYMKNNLELE